MLKDPGLCKLLLLIVSFLHFFWSLGLHNLVLDVSLQNRIWYMVCCSSWAPPRIGGEDRVNFQRAAWLPLPGAIFSFLLVNA